MANYPVDPTNAAEPTNARAGGYAAEELRALKGYLQTFIPGSAGRNKNRYCNGAFVFNQRGVSSYTINAAPETYTLDCLIAGGVASAGVFTVAGRSGDGCPGASNSVRFQTTTADAAPAATSAYYVTALIEGFDIADFGFGSTAPLPISISFWFRSSLTGVFSGRVGTGTGSRSYVVSWTYSTANVWQYVTLPNIPGDVAGVWNSTNQRALRFDFDLGSGANFEGTPGVWSASNLLGAPSGTNLITSLNATMDIALLQIELGTASTPFEWVPVAEALSRVRRYFHIGSLIIRGQIIGTVYQWIPFDVAMRTAPVMSLGVAGYTNGNTAAWFNASTVGAELSFTTTAVSGFVTLTNYSAAAEL